MTHTLGPWRTVLNDFGSLPTNHYLAVYGGDESCVAYALLLKQHWERGGDREHPVEANARLIAAAPDMKDAIEQALDDMADSHCVCEATKQMLKDALARAYG